MKIAIVGATGLVGREILSVLSDSFPGDELKVLVAASSKSVGMEVPFGNKMLVVKSVDDAISEKPQIAIFSAGGTVSRAYAEKFAQAGITVIDNSSAWRMQEGIPLIVPEINAGMLTKNDKIISNPNCSTIQMVMALAPLHRRYRIKRLVVSTYQSVTGTGLKAMNQLLGEREGKDVDKVYPYPIDMNLLPHAGSFTDNGYTEEEMKLVHETRKILEAGDMAITATVVRVPVMGGHSEAVNIEFREEYDMEEVRDILNNAPGITVLDDPERNIYPMPLFARGKNDTFVGRIRRDESLPRALNMWIVADNLRKGAATNAVQIAKYLTDNNLI